MKHKTPEYPTWEIRDFRDLLDGMEQRYDDNIAYLWRDPLAEDGIAARTYADMARDVKSLAAYLCAMGLEHKKIAVCGKNSYRWSISFLAIVCGCGVAVPLDREWSAAALTKFLTDAECDAILYEDDMRDKLSAVTLDGLLKMPLSLADTYLSQGDALREAGSRSYENHTVDADALGVLVYTAGCPGISRGVMLSQHNLCADIMAVCSRFRIREDDRMLSHLPPHQVYQITTSMSALYCGASVAFNDSVRRMPSDLSLFRPTVMVTVPAVVEFLSRFIEKGYAEARGGKLLLGVQKTATGIVSNTLGIVSKRTAEKSRRSIYSTVHSFLGGRLRAVIVGAAPLKESVFRQLEKYGYAVYSGYGLTEASPIALMHHDKYRAPDDVGYPIPGLEVRIDDPDDNGIGALCIKGPTVMLGYYQNEEATAAVLHDGWLSTGDFAQMTESCAIRITGTEKPVIVLPTGKKIVPAELESYVSAHPLVSACKVYAEGEDGDLTLCVSVYPDFAQLAAALSLQTETPDSDALKTLSEEDTARAKTLLLDIVRDVNAQLPQYKHIKKLVVRKTPFSEQAETA